MKEIRFASKDQGWTTVMPCPTGRGRGAQSPARIVRLGRARRVRPGADKDVESAKGARQKCQTRVAWNTASRKVKCKQPDKVLTKHQHSNGFVSMPKLSTRLSM